MDEQALVATARRGNAQAFNTLVLAYQTLAYNVAYRMVHDPDVAADVTQEAFISAFQAISRFRGGSFKAWLMRIVTNACYDHFRAQQRRPSSSLDNMLIDPDHSDLMRDRRESPEDSALRQDLGRVIQARLDDLPPDQRITVILSDIQGFSYQEIAQSTGVSLGTVKSRLSRGRSRLRDYLQEDVELLPSRYRLTNSEAE
jgi:RNA polymerase sigma-70 factor (ECF subfamily)